MQLLVLLAACGSIDLPEDWQARVRDGETLRYELGAGAALELREEGEALVVEREQGWALGVVLGLSGLLLLGLGAGAQLEARDRGQRAAGGLLGLGGLGGLLMIGDTRQSIDPAAGLAVDERELALGLFSRRAARELDASTRVRVDRECSEDDETVSCRVLVRLEQEGGWRMVWLELDSPVIEALAPESTEAAQRTAERFAAGLEAELRALER